VPERVRALAFIPAAAPELGQEARTEPASAVALFPACWPMAEREQEEDLLVFADRHLAQSSRGHRLGLSGSVGSYGGT